MTLRWYYSIDAATVVEITDRVRLPLNPEGQAIGIGKHAEAGSGWVGDLLIDDPEGDFTRPKAYRRIYAVQDAAPAGAQVVGNWFVGPAVKVRRMDPWSGAARQYVVSMADENSLLSRRKWTGADANRPAETDIVRIRWALGETELNVLSPDETYIDTTGPVTLEASDLRDHSPEEMLMTMFQRTKKEHWVKYEEAGAVGGAIVSSSVAAASVITTTTAHGLTTGQTAIIAGHSGSTPSINGAYIVTVTGATTYTIPLTVTVGGTGGTSSTVGRYVLCYFNPNTSSLLPSTLSISNDPADTIISGDNPTSLVYPLSDGAELDGSVERLSSGLIVPHLGSSKRVYVQNTTVGDEYAYKDNVANPPVPIKTEAEATAYANVELADLATPDDEVTTTLTIAAARMNLVQAGMYLPVHGTHFPNFNDDSSAPGWEDGAVDCRVKRRYITQLGPETFEMPLTLSPMTVPAVEQYGTNTDAGVVSFEWPVAEPSAGNLLIGFLATRGGGVADPDLVPWSTPTYGAGGFIPGTDWTQVTSFPVTDVAGSLSAVIAMAWREATADDTLYTTWGGLGAGTARPRTHQMEIAITAGAPSVTATSAEQTTAGTTYASPNIVVPAAGYIIAGFLFDSGGPADWAGWPGYTMTPDASAHTLTAGWCNSAFGGYSWFGYRYVSGAGTYHIELERADPPGWPHAYAASQFGWIVGFWAGAASPGYPA